MTKFLYRDRLRVAASRLPKCCQGKIPIHENSTIIADLVSAVQEELSLYLETPAESELHGEADVLECRRYLNMYEETAEAESFILSRCTPETDSFLHTVITENPDGR